MTATTARMIFRSIRGLSIASLDVPETQSRAPAAERGSASLRDEDDLEVPEKDRRVLARRREALPVRGDRDGEHLALVPFEHPGLTHRLHVPHADGAIVPSRDHPQAV